METYWKTHMDGPSQGQCLQIKMIRLNKNTRKLGFLIMYSIKSKK